MDPREVDPNDRPAEIMPQSFGEAYEQSLLAAVVSLWDQMGGPAASTHTHTDGMADGVMLAIGLLHSTFDGAAHTMGEVIARGADRLNAWIASQQGAAIVAQMAKEGLLENTMGAKA